MTDLKHCPFCGSTDVDRHGWFDGEGNQGPECMGCGATAESVDAWNRRALPEGMALVPRAITAETGHKSALMGEFDEEVEQTCTACHFDEPDPDCEVCGGEVTFVQRVPIDWTTIKAIHRRIVERSERGGEA